jgi:hypothetical protein
MIYSTKDSGNNSKLARAYASNQDAEGGYNSNSFLEESYIKNATNNFQHLKRDDVSFDSSHNQFS